ncbi:hypothetical protein GH714_008781 [Hevea brasiliensis]|nr:hypothetical protein GH714_008781 [Hevea brasiliensis]
MLVDIDLKLDSKGILESFSSLVGNRTLNVYSEGDDEIENLAALFMERMPTYHKWHVETIDKRTFGFLIEEGYVYFIIVGESLGNPIVLQVSKASKG